MCAAAQVWSGWCKPSRLRAKWNEGLDKLCAWRVADFGQQLQRLTEYQAETHALDNQCTRAPQVLNTLTRDEYTITIGRRMSPRARSPTHTRMSRRLSPPQITRSSSTAAGGSIICPMWSRPSTATGGPTSDSSPHSHTRA